MYQKFFRSYIVGSLALFSVLHAEGNQADLDSLLSQYRFNSDLSKQTKKESAGSVIVYTRDDLEKMQAYNLRDILKIIPMFTLQESHTGQVSLAKAKGSTFNSQFLKLYINDHEVGSVGFGSAMKMWGFVDISYIDHIEVYQIGSSIMSGDEPPGVIIRLYAKNADRDNGGAVTAMGGSRGSSEFNAQYGYKGEELSTFVYADKHNENRADYTSSRSPVPVDRDFDSTNFFASLSGDDFSIDIAQFVLESDRFLGFGRLRTPLENRSDLTHKYIVGTKYFDNKTLKLRLSYDDADHIQSESDPSGMVLYNMDGSTSLFNDWYFDKSETILDAVIDKELMLGNHDIHIAAQSKFKEFKPKTLTTDGVERSAEITGTTKWDLYSISLSDDWQVNEKNLFFLNLKYDWYDLNHGGKDFDDYVIRFGHVYNDGTWMWKSFAVRTYGYPVFIQSTYFPFIQKTNPNLVPEDRRALSTEMAYSTESSSTSLRLLYNTAKNAIALQQNAYINSSATPDFFGIYVTHEYKWTQDHRLSLSWYYGDDDMPTTQSPKMGGLVQFFNTLGKFDIYNELNYRSGFSYTTSAPSNQHVHVDAGVDYTAGIIYHHNKDLSYFLKGENLLNNMSETPYPASTYVDYATPMDRTIRFGMKCLF